MTDSANYHPDNTLLRRFVAGELPMGINLAVSSHVDQCENCQELVAGLSLAVGDAWLNESSEDNREIAAKLGAIFDTIVGQPAVAQPAAAPSGPTAVPPTRTPAAGGTVRLRDRPVRLPRLLDRIARGKLDWKEVASGIHQALLDVDSLTKCEYIYMDPGARVPTHTHLGSEYMLMLDGTMQDDFGDYGRGDFVVRHGQDCHGQVTEEGCICLFVTDAPLIFSEGKARLLNPLNRLRFWMSKLHLV